MDKYRIVEHNQGGNTWYTIEKKFLFWWVSETKGVYHQGFIVHETIKFDSLLTAEKYLDQKYTTKVVKTLSA